ncbi:MAG: helix-turn-helix transcriptional regulator [Spirulina sp. SIO3F2]|nr:helix-turn-helix transcriptional regulator [Spirulina sp. SIO3F2]
MLNWSQKIKLLRRLPGLNQSQFANVCDLTQAAISQFESGQRSPGRKSVLKIAIACEISAEVLMRNYATSKDMALAILTYRLRRSPIETVRALENFVSIRYPQ